MTRASPEPEIEKRACDDGSVRIDVLGWGPQEKGGGEAKERTELEVILDMPARRRRSWAADIATIAGTNLIVHDAGHPPKLPAAGGDLPPE